MRDETPRKLNAGRGFSISYKGKTLLSLRDPVAQAERAASAAHYVSRTLYFCPSPLLGYGLSRVLTNASSDSALLCVEADERLMELSMREIEKSVLEDPRVRLVQTRDPLVLADYARSQWGSRSFRRIEVLRLGGGWQLYPEVYEELAGVLGRNIAIDWGNAATLMALGRRYAKNAVRNLALVPRASPLPDFGDCPALVLGAGPSLDSILDRLKKTIPSAGQTGHIDDCNRPFRIIAVDTAIRSLRDRDIAPDLVVALEAQHYNLKDFTGSRGWPVAIAMDLSAITATAETLGELHLFFTPWTRLSLFDRLEKAGILPAGLPPLGSVGLSAVALARRLTRGPIITGGLDFSYSAEAYHAKSAPGSLERQRTHNRFGGLIAASAFRNGVFRVKAKTGAAARSDAGLKRYRDIFEEEFSGDARIRDLLTDGLPLGIPVIGFDECLDLLLAGRRQSNATRGSPNGDQNGTGREAISAKTAAFIREELVLLNELKAQLTGKAQDLDRLLDECDYLWAHFPECAGRDGGRPGIGDISFLKRVRIEIEPFIGLFESVKI